MGRGRNITHKSLIIYEHINQFFIKKNIYFKNYNVLNK